MARVQTLINMDDTFNLCTLVASQVGGIREHNDIFNI